MQAGQSLSSLQERLRPQVGTVEVQEVEGMEAEGGLVGIARAHGPLERVKVRLAAFVAEAEFAVELRAACG
jgi:hypothetical protein